METLKEPHDMKHIFQELLLENQEPEHSVLFTLQK